MKKLLLCFLVFFVFVACSSKKDSLTDDESGMNDFDNAVNDEMPDEGVIDPDDTDVACGGPQLVKDGVNVSAAQYI